jgi:hypothetical protein
MADATTTTNAPPIGTDADFMAGLDPEARTLFAAVEEVVHQDGDTSFRLDVGQAAPAAPAAQAPATPQAAPAAAGPGQEATQAPPADAQPVIPPPPAELPPAQKAYLERKARKESESRLAQENTALRESMAAIARGIEQRNQLQQPYDPQQQEPAWNVDPELQAFLEDRDQRLMAGMQQMLSPVLQEKQQQQQFQQIDLEQQQVKQHAVQFISEVDGLEREYASSPEGAGYYDRAGQLDRKMTEFYGGLVAYGADPARVEQVVKAQMIGAYKVAEWLGVNPAIYVDYVAKNFGAAGNGSHVNGPTSNGNEPAPTPPARFPAAPSQQVQMAANAQTNGLARATPAGTQTVDTNSPDFIVDQLASGQFSPQTLEGWAKEGGDEAVIRNIMKVAAAAGRRG